MTLSTAIQLKVTSNLTSSLDLVRSSAPLAYSKTISLSSGVGANQANNIFSDTRTLAASISEELDFAGGLTNPLGQSLVFVKIKALIIYAATANTNNVLVGGASSNGFAGIFNDATDIVRIRPGGMFAMIAPDTTAYVVTPATGDLLKVANSSSGTSVSYDIIVIGVE